MKIPKKIKFQQISFNNLWDIDFHDFMNLYKNSTAKSYYCLSTGTSFALDNSLRFEEESFRKNLLERI